MAPSTTGGFARIHSIASLTDTTLEQLHRGTAPFSNAYGAADEESLRASKKSCLEQVGRESDWPEITTDFALPADVTE
ncbi:hypothetical protein [Streptomyces sp. NPDC051677]|uniref:hypothetical protein n=1 Tax=Streptomyces sp. NPDC051677 TaxID=3365669 RepID=UPI0037D3D462